MELEAANGDEKPKRVSIPDGVEPADVDLAYAVKLLQLPRTVGEDPKSGEKVVTGIGRYGPFARRGKTFASLRSVDDLWDVSLDDAVALLDAKEAGKRVPLKELGKHPETGAEISVMSGRYGPYVTDGDINATIPKGTDPEDVDLETAVQMLSEKAAKGGGRRRRKSGGAGGRKGSKKGGKKKG